MRWLLLILLSMSCHSVADCATDSVPHRWIKVIEEQNWDALQALFAEDSRYHDPTMAFFDTAEIDLRGPLAIRQFWQESSEGSGTSAIDYTITNCFQAGAMAVLTLKVAVTVAGDTWGIKKESVVLRGAQTSVLRLENGLIVDATDLVDYGDVMGQVEALKQTYGAHES
ncbi:MAG: nuclear transport factor 2 family protein [Halioglobus sp.]